MAVPPTSGVHGEPTTNSRACGVIAKLFLAAGLCELVPSVRVNNDDVRARGDRCDGAPQGRGHRNSIRRAGTATMTFQSVGLGVRLSLQAMAYVLSVFPQQNYFFYFNFYA